LITGDRTEDLDDLARVLAKIRPPNATTLTIETPRFSYWTAQANDLHLRLQRLCWPPVAIAVTQSREEVLAWKS
jgi:hypothetical protein